MTAKFLTIRDAAARLDLPPRTLRDLVLAGRGPVAVRMGPKMLRFTPQALDEFVERRTIRPIDEALAA